MPENVRRLGHVPTAHHNAFNATPLAVLNVARDSTAACDFSPATRMFEAAGAAACIITDAWERVDSFLEPGREVLVAEDGAHVASIVSSLSEARARIIGENAPSHHGRAYVRDASPPGRIDPAREGASNRRCGQGVRLNAP